MTRKFVYDARAERVRFVTSTTGSHGTRPGTELRRSLPWLAVVLVVVASVLAFDAAHASPAEIAPPAASR